MEKYNYWLTLAWATEYSSVPTEETVTLAELSKDKFLEQSADKEPTDAEYEEIDRQLYIAGDRCRSKLLDTICQSMDCTCTELMDNDMNTDDILEYSEIEMARHNMFAIAILPTAISEEEYNQLSQSSASMKDFINVWMDRVVAVKHRMWLTNIPDDMYSLETLRKHPSTQCAMEVTVIVSCITGEKLSAFESGGSVLRAISYNNLALSCNICSADLNRLARGDLKFVADVLPMSEPSEKLFDSGHVFRPNIPENADAFTDLMRSKIERNDQREHPIRLHPGNVVSYVMNHHDVMFFPTANNWDTVLKERLSEESE